MVILKVDWNGEVKLVATQNTVYFRNAKKPYVCGICGKLIDVGGSIARLYGGKKDKKSETLVACNSHVIGEA